MEQRRRRLPAHWPTRLHLLRASVGQTCDAAGHPEPTGDLRADLIAGLVDLADRVLTASGKHARFTREGDR
ncbi:hypothetical protein [Nonomuraea sp. SBT364]|uniref:hypothetical protein n=1 Tax=Nonomuraea sp. SBT364 TaxID=1580530 RepID=UPI00066EA4E3|nr:hypothetical protein [Nonomuraea sp. SBT364]